MLFLVAMLTGCSAPDTSGDGPVLLQIGDSLTWRVTPTYPVYLPDLSPPYDTIGTIETEEGLRVEGHGGYTSGDAMLDLPSWAATYERAPTHCLVLLGVNDVGYDVPAEEIVANLTTIDRFLVVNFDCDVRIGQIPSQGPGYANIAAGVVAANMAIREAFPEAVDLHTGFDPEVDLLEDGLHPNDAGAMWMAQRWAESLWE